MELKTPKHALIDGVERNAAAPATFSIPSLGTREDLSPEQYIKIGTLLAPDGAPVETEAGGIEAERFWAQVVEVRRGDGAARYVVRVDNDLVFPDRHGLQYNDLIEIEPRHVLAVD